MLGGRTSEPSMSGRCVHCCCEGCHDWESEANMAYRAVSPASRHGEGSWIHVPTTELRHEAGNKARVRNNTAWDSQGLRLCLSRNWGTGCVGRRLRWVMENARIEGCTGSSTATFGRIKTPILYIDKTNEKGCSLPGHRMKCKTEHIAL